MRKWHRWLSVFFALFLLWIAGTGLASHVTALWPEAAASAPEPPPPGWQCPEGWRCRPPAPEGSMRSLVGLFHHLHSGESFGPVGTAISILSGLALAFFSISGIWMYVRMFRRRPQGARRLFWD